MYRIKKRNTRSIAVSELFSMKICQQDFFLDTTKLRKKLVFYKEKKKPKQKRII